MADDARISTALPSHPKTRKLKRRLGAQGLWSLVCLFLWTADNRCDGDLTGLTDEDIELASDWDGEAGAFVQALLEVRFLDGNADSHSVHDWVSHQPWAAARGKRVDAARLAARKRWDMRPACGPDADGMPGACGDNKTAMPTTQPNPTTPHPTPPKEQTPPGASARKGVSRHSPKRTASTATPSQDAKALADLLLTEIVRNKPDFHVKVGMLYESAVEADRMLRIDGRAPERAAAVIRFAQGDDFWRANILSMAKVREKFDALELKMRQKGNGHGQQPNKAEQQIANYEAARAKGPISGRPV